MSKNTILCGFMGCGKTTVGRYLAKKTGYMFIDMDRFIEEKEQKTISEIFQLHGEDYFRDLEHNACKELAQKQNLVIAAGGGALTFKRNVNVLKKTGNIVFLDVPLPVLSKRLVNDTTRPLLQRPDKEQAMKKLFHKRIPLYKAASNIKVNGRGSPLVVVNRIMKKLKYIE